MTNLKDILLLIPQDINFINSTFSDGTPFTNVNDSKAYRFSNETSCISSFYTRLLPKINTDGIRRVIVKCVDILEFDQRRIKIGVGFAEI